jgi:hypothetical protein
MVGVDGGDLRMVRVGGGGVTNMTRTRNSKELDAKTSTSTRRCRHKFNYAKLKRQCKAWQGVYGTI